MFEMTEGSWIGGLSGCINLGDYDAGEWYVRDCIVSDVQISVSGAGSHVGGLNGGGLSEGELPHSFLVDGCTLKGVVIETDAENLEEALTGTVIGESLNCQMAGADGSVIDITDRNIDLNTTNTSAEVSVLHPDGSGFPDASAVGQVI